MRLPSEKSLGRRKKTMTWLSYSPLRLPSEKSLWRRKKTMTWLSYSPLTAAAERVVVLAQSFVTLSRTRRVPKHLRKRATTSSSRVPVIEKYKLPPIQIFDKNCPLKCVNQKFAIFQQNVRKLEPFWLPVVSLLSARAAPLVKKRQYLA